MERIEVHNQKEFDACVADGNVAIVINCSVAAWENSSVEALENSSVVARENSSVVALENSSVEAWENAFIRFFSALKITASIGVVILKHHQSEIIEGGRQLELIELEPRGGEAVTVQLDGHAPDILTPGEQVTVTVDADNELVVSVEG